MAILLSFFEISKIISNWSCSILFIDEILDSGVDQSGIEQFISTLYNIVSEENKELGIYLISHKLTDVQVNWNEVIEIEKKSLFSELKVK
jgi:ABC-type Mn2+/Zn2+ transport system ATPase subunit